MNSILIVSSNSRIGEEIRRVLSSEYRADIVSTLEQSIQKYETRRYEFIFIDLTVLQSNLIEHTVESYRKALQPFWRIFPSAQIIVLSSQASLREAVRLVKAGASNYLTIPINPTELQYVLETVDESIRMQLELDYLRDQFWKSDDLAFIRTNSVRMKEVFEKIRSVAPKKTTVLLLGETGVGKGVISKLIHRYSERQEQPFIHLHCGTIPDPLLESELFGHEKGAFTGATRRKLGRFEIAKGGTIFLDEISTITPSAQIKLLQVLQDKVFQRVGGETIIETDARVIAASNLDLKKLRDTGEFRSDLYYRLNVFPIEILPLRERHEDILLLAQSFLETLNHIYFKDIYAFHPLVVEAMTDYSWPGNIRELENLIERAYVLETSAILTPESFPQELFNSDLSKAKIKLDTTLSLAQVRRLNVEQVERQYLKELLSSHQGKINKTAIAAGISTRQLHKLLKKYEIQKEEFKTISYS